MFDGGDPFPPGAYPDMGPPDLFCCILLAWMIVALLSLLLPRRYFVKLFKIAFPFFPDKLE